MKKDYLLFVGENATTGTPNTKTGNLSYYGNYFLFSTKEERETYINEMTGFSSREIVKKGTRKTLRKYDLGCSVETYNYYLDRLDFTIKTKKGYWM